MNVTGTGMVFKNEHTTNGETWYSYAIGISSKDMDGNYISSTMPVRFKKGVALDDRTRIEITNGFIRVKGYEKEGKTRKLLEIMVLDFDIVKQGNPDGFTSLQDEDIPF